MLVNIDNEIIKLLRLKEPDVIEGAVNVYLIRYRKNERANL